MSAWSSFPFVACGNYAKANDRTAQCHVNINIAPTGYVCILANGTGFYNLIGKLAELRIEQELFFSKKTKQFRFILIGIPSLAVFPEGQDFYRMTVQYKL